MGNLFKIIFLFLFIISSLFSSEIEFSKEEKSYLKNNPTLVVQGLSAFPPFNYQKNGISHGYTVDYMNLVAKYLDIDIKFTKPKSFAETLSMFKNGEIDILPHIARNKTREKFVDYTDFNHIEYILGVTIRKGDGILDIKDLEDKTIAVVNKSFIQTFLNKKYPYQKVLSLASTAEAVEAVALGKADALIGSIPTMNFYIQKNWHTNIYTTRITNLGLSSKVSMPMGVQEGNEILKSILEKVNIIIPFNEIVKLKKKWLDIDVNNNSNLLTEDEKNYLSKKDVIKMCVLPDWLPFEQIDEDGVHKGIGADILKIISEKIEKDFLLVPTKQWSESLQNIRDRKCDVLPVAMDIPSRRDAMNFTKPYVSEPFVLATKSNEFFIKDEQQLSHKKVGIVASYAFIEVMKQKNPLIKIVEVKNTKEGLEKVSSGELFAYLDTMPTVGYFIQKYGMVDLKIAGKLDYDITLSVASRNDEPLLNTIMQKALNGISKEETRKIVGRWIEIKVHQEFDYKKLFYVIGFFTLIVLVVLYKNRSIHKINKRLHLANKEIQEQHSMVNKYVMLLSTDLNGIIIDVNDAYCNKLGFSKYEFIGRNHDLIKHPAMSPEYFKNLWETIESDKIWRGEIKNLNKNSETVYFDVVIEPLLKDGKKVGYKSISEDITDKKRIEELSITDKLTSLYNRLKIDELILNHINYNARYQTPFSIILFDIDNFKMVNDTYGHDIGDFVLEKVARTSKSCIRKTDEIGRWGGEEFIVICPNIEKDSAKIVAEHLRKSIEETIFGRVGQVTISLGVSSFEESDDVSTLFKRVDNALFKAKKSGRNRTIVL